jgi:hypothetical protein
MNRYAVIDNQTNKVVNIIIADNNYTIDGYSIVLSNDEYEYQFQQYLNEMYGTEIE